ncbi:lysylphosphatidylglycerol synthase transmembrane domain-containing protein [Streptomyces sp. NPDC051907]|uniref:lysylphosphatidylglycerol synthase transmembrane domain-containing protein n=1 Tax=Streptomyces sp. NPDC051907 TaxID=3155284 RepID=UPI0034234054
MRRLPLRQIVCLTPIVLIALWAAAHGEVIADGLRRLRGADPLWLLAAVGVTCLCWVAASCVRQGAIIERLPAGRLLASQFAAGAANHVLPAGLGAHAVTLRFLRNCGVPLSRGTASLALYSLVEPIARVLLLIVLLLAVPGALPLDEVTPDGGALAVLLGVVTAVLAALLASLCAIRRLRRAARDFLRTALSDARVLHTRPARVLALWGGAFAFPALQGCVLASVALALEAPLPWLHAAIAYLAASVAAGMVPTPGGIGSVDAALVVTLVAAGAPLTVATAVVLGFRIITLWLPLLPGALVLGALVRWKVL